MYIAPTRFILAFLVGLTIVSLPRLASAAETGILELTANVEGALVFVDGELVGEIPYLEILPAGTHRIRVERPGFQTFDQQVRIAADSTVEINAELLRLAPGLEVRVDVESAKVFLDGEHVGTGSLVVVDPAEAGSHRVVVEAEPFGRWAAQVQLEPGVLTPVTVSLRGSLGSVAVHTDPEGASVLFDGKDYGLTPVTVDPVETGSHWIRLSLEGYSDVFRALTVDSGRKVTVDATLSTEGGHLVVKPSVAEGKVYLNGVALGEGRQEIGPIKPGLYSVRVTAADHTDFMKTVQVKDGAKAVVAARLASFNYGKSNRLVGPPEASRPVAQRPAFWAVLGGGVGAAAIGITTAVVAASRSSADAGTGTTALVPPETDVRYALP
ncbi:MAG TPA: hypothetical protein DIU15_17745 [Deltaproteobacteria bacterium]|nr:hypothetical protein [Deltaproteobacteria bacterium]HCP47887.1 hypothetical protein [Deltaproteobacteria bacterium]